MAPRPGWGAALGVSVVATPCAPRVRGMLRDVWQIRPLPERVMEWLLLFVPLDVFERGLQRFGASAKEFALLGTLIGMGLVLFGLGALALRADWSSWRLLALGLAL